MFDDDILRVNQGQQIFQVIILLDLWIDILVKNPLTKVFRKKLRTKLNRISKLLDKNCNIFQTCQGTSNLSLFKRSF